MNVFGIAKSFVVVVDIVVIFIIIIFSLKLFISSVIISKDDFDSFNSSFKKKKQTS